ncbi:MAG: peptidoglycan D,D-transpeptidase FtsI family protein [Methanosarcinaceae archaeon]
MRVKKDFKPRMLIVFLFFAALYSIVLFRLFVVQIHQQSFFSNLAKQQYMTEISMQPPRAILYDRNKQPLVINHLATSAFVLPREFSKSKETKAFLKKYFSAVLTSIEGQKKRRFFWLERHIPEERLKWLKSFKNSDIHFLQEPDRFYTFPSSAHVVGFTDIDNVGIAGLELQFNNVIGGTPTTVELEKDARSGHFYFKKDVKQAGEVGSPVTTTIDKDLQFLVFEEIKKAVDHYDAKAGAGLIMDPSTGDILAMVSYPGFDPGKRPIKNLEETKNILVTEGFELGSVIKVFTALAALEEGVATMDEEIDSEGKSTYIDGFRVENWKPMGVMTFAESIDKSSNVASAKIAKRLGPKLYEHLRRLGFGRQTGIQFPGERTGFINHPYNWSRSSVLVLSFGYEIMATLLQVAKAFSIIANDGYNVKPRLILDPQKRRLENRARLYGQETIDNVKDILDVKGWFADLCKFDGYRIMKKTGTARLVKDGKYSKKSHVYTIAGIVEKGDYKRVIVLFVKEPKNPNILAAQLMAPVFPRVVERMLVHDALAKA